MNHSMANSLFYPNVCHVCKRFKGIELLICSGCCMISYCGIEHQTQHWQQHEPICKAIQNVLGNKMNTNELTEMEWRRKKLHNMYMVSHKLECNLEKEEEHMFLFSRVCVVCNRQDQLTLCSNCSGVNFYINHRYNSQSQHENLYKLLCYIFVLDLFDIMYPLLGVERHNYCSLNFSAFKSLQSFDNMSSFMDTFAHCSSENQCV